MHGLYLLWWVDQKGVSPALVAAVLAAGEIALTLVEIPTGWLADRYGHRASLLAGSATQVAGMLLCWLGEGLPGLLAASLLVALGDAFRSGADQALLYRSCRALDRETDFQRIEARTRGLELVVLVALVLAGGMIVKTWGFAVGWAIEVCVSAAGFALACAMTEPPPATVPSPMSETEPNSRVDAVGPLNAAAGGVGRLLRLILPASLLGGVAAATLFLAQTASGVDAGRATTLVAIVTLAEAAGAWIAIYLTAGARAQFALAGVGALLAGAAIAAPGSFLAVVVGLSFLLGVMEPLRAATLQQEVTDDRRARAASIASASDKALTTLALLCAGMLPRRRP